MLDVGDRMPGFTLPVSYADGRKQPVPFHSFLGRSPVVLHFFPLAFTKVCTRQVCEVRDAHDLDALGALTLGFSCDSHHANAAFAREQGLRHGLVSDPNREVVDRIWETQEAAGVRRVAKRGWLVLDAGGTVAARWVTDDPEEWSGVAPIRDALAKLAARA